MSSPNPLAPGTVLLGRYECLRVLGRGAMGEVLDVRDLRSGERYALKRVPPEIARQHAQMQAVRMNFKLVNGLTHPHIAVTRFLETDESTGEVFILMDLVRGRDLQTWVLEERRRRGDLQAPLPLGLVLGIAEQAALALDYAHFQPIYADDGAVSLHGVLHRDFKPSNVMVVDGREHRPGVPYVKVVDFGLAAEIQGSMLSQTQYVDHVNPLAGTPLYMAPEQWQGRRLTRAIDQWALAVLIYEMAEGCPPFPGPTRPELREQVLNQPPLTPEVLSPEQWAALAVSFDKDRARRRASCLELVEAMAAAAPGSLGSVGRPQNSESSSGRNGLSSSGKSGTSSGGAPPVPPSRPRSGEGSAPAGSAWNNDSSPVDATYVPTASRPFPPAAGSSPPPAADAPSPSSAPSPPAPKPLASRDTGRLAVDQTLAPPPSQAEPAAAAALGSSGRSSSPGRSSGGGGLQNDDFQGGRAVGARLAAGTPRRRSWSPAARWLTGVLATLSAAAITLASTGFFSPPAPPPAVGPGTLVVEIDPPDAQLVVDDGPPRAMSGRQSAWEVPPGLRRIRIEKEGFSPFLREAVFRSGERERWLVHLLPTPSGATGGDGVSGGPLALRPIPPQTATAGAPLSFQAALAGPPPPGGVRFELVSPSPALAEIDPQSGQVRWTPAADSPAWKATLRIRVRPLREGPSPMEMDVAVDVAPAPSTKRLPPRVAEVPEQRLAAGETLRVQLAAVDPNPSPVAVRFELVPPTPKGAELDPAGLLKWTPLGAASIGSHTLRVRAVSSAADAPSAEVAVAVRVTAPMRERLVVGTLAALETVAGGQVRTTVRARNPNTAGAPPHYRLTHAPTGATIDELSGHFHWTAPEVVAEKRYQIQGTVWVDDEFMQSHPFEFAVLVRPGPPRPLRAPFTPAEAAAAQASWARLVGRPEVVKNTIGMELAVLPPGEYVRGANDYAAEPDERPPHRVRLSRPVWIGKYEVTRGQFATFVHEAKFIPKTGEHSHGWDEKTGKFDEEAEFTWKDAGVTQAEDHPVVNISWDDAAAFCAWLSKKEGATYRLPTEAEWEYACRAGSTTIFQGGDEDGKLYPAANLADSAAKRKFPKFDGHAPPDGYIVTAPVGKFHANAFGLFDMHGNAWEWCSDWYGEKAYAPLHDLALPAVDPVGPSTGEMKVLRGGAWCTPAASCRSSHRGNEPPDHRLNSVGFRVVLDPKFKN